MWLTIKFICSKCGVESWMEINNEKCILKASDLLCDDCNPIEEDE